MVNSPHRSDTPWAVFLIFLRMGLTSFGGPVAHLGYFHQEFVVRRRWLTEVRYADLVALCQFLPGPASSQVGIALGLGRAGHAGALAAWLGFTLPSAVLMVVFAYGLGFGVGPIGAGALHGLALVAVAVVALATLAMTRSLCPHLPERLIMLTTAIAVITAGQLVWLQGALLLCVAILGGLTLRASSPAAEAPAPKPSRLAGVEWLLLFFIVLLLTPVAATFWAAPQLELFERFYRTGSLVFGGGHVVLPLLQAEVVTPGSIDPATFLAGYGAAQALPGPLFSFAAFLGASMGGWSAAVVAVVAIFLPSFLLVFGALPYWELLRAQARVRAALKAVNAAVVGLVLAALIDLSRMVWVDAHSPWWIDIPGLVLAIVALHRWRQPPWLVVLLGGVAGVLLDMAGLIG